jgi:hypothetical protein
VGKSNLITKVLVIGTFLDGRADCVAWQGIFPNIEEYDSVIIDLQSLYQSTFDDLYRNESEWKKIQKAHNEIDILLGTGREIFCVINEHLSPTPRPGEPKAVLGPLPSNYDILPMYPSVGKQEGTSKTNVSRRFRPYMDQVEKWNYELSARHLNLSSIAKNKSGKLIAGTLSFGKGSIHFLPPPTECTLKDAIEILLDLILKPPTTKHPAWRAQVTIPGMSAVEENIRDLQNRIGGLNKQLERLQSEETRLDRFRDLVSPSGTGDYLESLVKDVLGELGIKLSKTAQGFPVDLLGPGFAVEVTGVSRGITVRSEKFNQALRFLEERHHGEKVAVIANTYKNIEPGKRPPQHFSKEILEILKARHVCLLTTVRLHELWTAVSKGELSKEAAARMLNETDGEL